MMSGGSMNYLYSTLEYASFDKSTPERKAFAKHIQLVAKALHDIEWVDSGDYGLGRENDAIRACLDPGAVLDALIEHAKETVELMRVEIKRVEGNNE
jgi:hypothetical protein